MTNILSSVNTELEQATALKYLYGWLRNHPKYGAIAPPELADSLYHADVSALSLPQLNLTSHSFVFKLYSLSYV